VELAERQALVETFPDMLAVTAELLYTPPTEQRHRAVEQRDLLMGKVATAERLRVRVLAAPAAEPSGALTAGPRPAPHLKAVEPEQAETDLLRRLRQPARAAQTGQDLQT